ncbi:MAG: hypothetical protein RIE24_03615 [Silicimonas sp.]|uniref:hypothetical protein n=1 Tax=Alphaproteobacteria TaxID=28211 RepID=UPI0032ED61F9
MALTPAEKQKAYRERELAERRAAPDSAYPYLRETFSEFLEREGNYQNVEIALGLAGFEAPLIDDERDPEAFALEEVIAGVDNPFPGSKGALGRAQVIIECLIDAASELANVVNNYEREQLKARLAELGSSDTTDRTTAIDEAVKLNKMLDLLKKRVRKDFPQWKVTGI